MYQSPHIQMQIARARHDDMLRDARKHELAARVREERPGPVARLRARFGPRVPAHTPATNPAPATNHAA